MTDSRTGVDTDICIVGAGPVGLFVRALLRAKGVRCLLLEARSAAANLSDRRVVALSWGSHLKLLRVGVDVRHSPEVGLIKTIHVSQAAKLGRTTLSALDANLPALGFVVAYRELVHHLLEASDGPEDLRYGTLVEAVEETHGGVRICGGNGPIHARAAVIADGSGDMLARSGFHVDALDYGSHALVATVTASQSDGSTAYERFTRYGPLALLPRGKSHSMVWALPEKQALEVQNQGPDVLLARLQSAFGWRLGRFTAATDTAVFPLGLRTTRPVARGRIVVLGNAAQTLHPVAGQGLNLGFRDAWSLARDLSARTRAFDSAFATYALRRQTDRMITMSFTDFLARAFVLTTPGSSLARTALLEFLDLVPGPRKFFSRLLSITPPR
ncbi:MAG: FAD-dependent monooxygenase [Betaproteobacteria bacterium]|jgi:2-octaprenyl-6-methoxyphenol hydroxylase